MANCKNCGEKLRTGFCSNCGFDNARMKFDDNYLKNGIRKHPEREVNVKKKDSALSIVSMVVVFFSMFGFNFIALFGVICGVVDLCINDEEKRHIGSIFGVIVGIINIIAYFSFLKNF